MIFNFWHVVESRVTRGQKLNVLLSRDYSDSIHNEELDAGCSGVSL